MKTKLVKKIGLILAANIILALTITLPGAWVQEYKKDEILIKFKSSSGQEVEVLQALCAEINTSKTKKYQINKVHHLKLQQGTSVEYAVITAYTDPNVEYAEANYKLNINTTLNDPSFSKLYGLHNSGQTGGTAEADIDAPEAWNLITDVPDNIVIAAIDTTGINQVIVNNQTATVNGDTFTVSGITPAQGKNTILAQATDTLENTGSTSITVIKDITSPSAPTGLKASAGDSKVELTWDENTEQDLAGYNIYRKEVSSPASAVITSESVYDSKAEPRFNESDYPLSLVKIFLSEKQDIDSLLTLDIAVYGNMGTYAIAEVTDSELDKLSSNGFTYKILDTDSQAKQYYMVWAPTPEKLETIYHYATVLDIEKNTAIICTDEETAIEIPQRRFQIRPIRRRPLTLIEKTAVSYKFSSTDTSEQEFISDIISNVEESSVSDYIQTLQDFGTRLSQTDGYDLSAEYALNEFKKMGIEAEYHQFTMYGQTKNNVVATLTGKTNPEKIFIICAHLDCVSNDSWNYAPGAEDNASGSAMVLEAARVLSHYFFDSTIKFILFGGEEQGGWGSDGYVEDLGGDIEKVAGVINCDMIAYLDTPDNDLSITSHSSWQELANKIVNIADTYESINIKAYNVVDDNAWWSDHWVFWEYGRPAICAIEYEESHFYPYYHSTEDTIDKIDTSFAAEVAELCIASLAELAGPITSLPSPPAGYEKINDSPITATNYIDTNLTNGTTYIYIVTAVDNSGNESSYFNKVPAMPANNSDPDPEPEPPPPNLAPSATATASSEYSSGYRARNVIDGLYGLWDQGEWAAQGLWDKKPWVKLSWSSPQTVNKIIIYGRPNKYDKISNAKITLSNGYSSQIGEIPIGGAPKIVYFPEAEIKWVKFQVLETIALNAGLAEIQLFYDPVAQNDSNLALTATATASSEYSASYIAGNAIDRIVGQWDIGEWAARGSWDRTPWLKLSWRSLKTVNKLVIYGRPNRFDSIQNAKITLSNGFSTQIGEIPIGGAPKIIYLPSSQRIIWLKLNILETDAINPGITEIEVYNEASSVKDSNLTKQASASASSRYSGSYSAGKAIDGIVGQWDVGEWAARGLWDRTPWLKLSWSSPQTVNKTVIYGRPNKYDCIQSAKITLSNGYSVNLGEIPIGGAPKEIYFPTAVITWLKFQVLETTAINPGLAEIEVYYDDTSSSSLYSYKLNQLEIEQSVGRDNLIMVSANQDIDGDGIYNKFDMFDTDPTEWEDTDGDDLGNNADLDDDDDEVLDEDDAYPLDIKMAEFKNNPVELSKLELSLDNIPDVDTIFIIIPEEIDIDKIKSYVNTVHNQETLIMPYIYNTTDIEYIKDRVIDNDYDGVIVEETEKNFISNLSAALHNRGRQLIVSAVYTEDLDLYDIEPYLDKLIIKHPDTESIDAFSVESVILDIRFQVPEEKLVMEIPITYSCSEQIKEILNKYNVLILWY